MKQLKISDVQIVPFRPRDGHLGFASCVINNQFYLSDLAIFSRPNGGIRLGFPVKRLTNGSSLDIFKPLTPEVEVAMEAAVTAKYQSIMECNGKGMELADEQKK